jgi:hypothetical protein
MGLSIIVEVERFASVARIIVAKRGEKLKILFLFKFNPIVVKWGHLGIILGQVRKISVLCFEKVVQGS